MDPRVAQLAKNLVNYSLDIRTGEKVLIEHMDSTTEDLARALVQEVYAKGAIPFVETTNLRIFREILLKAPDEFFNLKAKWESERMRDMDCYIGIRGANNVSEWADIPSEQMGNYQRLWFNPVHSKIRVNKTKWVVLRYPSPSMAQLSNMSTSAFEEFYFNVCNLDYSLMDRAMDPLKELMLKTDRVRITGPGTDLSFSIKDIDVQKCSGHRNIPDGEVYTAPLRDSVNGTLQYNTPAVYQGFTFENVKLTFKEGKITEATANDTMRINEVFDTDEGARYIGEFALGVNPYIDTPMKDTLFDEKIKGSFHFTPGNAYEEADNGNRSSIHWDLVCIQRAEYGGGEIYFDDVLIRKDGLFVIDELLALNPENLK